MKDELKISTLMMKEAHQKDEEDLDDMEIDEGSTTRNMSAYDQIK